MSAPRKGLAACASFFVAAWSQSGLAAEEAAASGAAADPAPAALSSAAPSPTPAKDDPAQLSGAELPPMTDYEAAALAEATSEPLLKFYGFGDLGYRHFFVKGDSAWFQYLNREPSFFVGNLNLYIDAQLSDRWRALAEVRFTYLPHGSPDTTLVTPAATRYDGEVADYTDFSRSRAVGGIMLERAILEYTAFTFLSVTAGHWLTPYGVWNVDHGSPVIIGVSKPFIIGADLLPASQVGILVHGTAVVHELELGYALGISNGRIDKVPFEDLDGNKALTGRLAVTTREVGEATLGGTVYYGRATTGVSEVSVVSGKPKSLLAVTEQFDELSYAADLKWVWQDLHLQAEGVVNDRKYTAEGRPRGRNGGLVPDKRNLGFYALLGYRTPFMGLMPYARAEYSAEPQLQSLGLADHVTIVVGGLNFRPDPRVVLKAEYGYGAFSGGGPQGFGGSAVQGLDMQAAWAF